MTVYFLQRRDHAVRVALQITPDRGVRLNLQIAVLFADKQLLLFLSVLLTRIKLAIRLIGCLFKPGFGHLAADRTGAEDGTATCTSHRSSRFVPLMLI